VELPPPPQDALPPAVLLMQVLSPASAQVGRI
jgi:hypothetical protein